MKQTYTRLESLMMTSLSRDITLMAGGEKCVCTCKKCRPYVVFEGL